MSVDGGLLDNYPIAIFDQQKYLPNKSLDYNPETLGIFPTSESGAASSLYDIALLLTKFNDMDPEIMQKFLSALLLVKK